jgi:PKHD-type hydroxylase
MITEVPSLLTAAQVKQLRDLAATAKFVDGRISNPHNETKKNLQLDQDDAVYLESSKVLAEALLGNEEVKNFSFINRFAPPLICRYEPDMSYGKHADNAFVNVGQTKIRSDISCTIFLSHPESYEGGELAIHMGSRTVEVKGAAGSAVLYPSTSIHEVLPVTQGERLVAITFIESQVMDEHKRELLYTLNEVAALEGYNISWDNRVLLQHVSASLHRMWST